MNWLLSGFSGKAPLFAASDAARKPWICGLGPSLLGHQYDASDAGGRALLADAAGLLLITYRQNMTPIASDTNWGCTVRSTQMLWANTLLDLKRKLAAAGTDAASGQRSTSHSSSDASGGSGSGSPPSTTAAEERGAPLAAPPRSASGSPPLERGSDAGSAHRRATGTSGSSTPSPLPLSRDPHVKLIASLFLDWPAPQCFFSLQHVARMGGSKWYGPQEVAVVMLRLAAEAHTHVCAACHLTGGAGAAFQPPPPALLLTHSPVTLAPAPTRRAHDEAGSATAPSAVPDAVHGDSDREEAGAEAWSQPARLAHVMGTLPSPVASPASSAQPLAGAPASVPRTTGVTAMVCRSATVALDEVTAAACGYTSLESSADFDLSRWQPVLVIVPLCLGRPVRLPQEYYPFVLSAARLPSFAGAVGGSPGHSVYFVGACGDGLLCLDPHVTRPCPTYSEAALMSPAGSQCVLCPSTPPATATSHAAAASFGRHSLQRSGSSGAASSVSGGGAAGSTRSEASPVGISTPSSLGAAARPRDPMYAIQVALASTILRPAASMPCMHDATSAGGGSDSPAADLTLSPSTQSEGVGSLSSTHASDMPVWQSDVPRAMFPSLPGGELYFPSLPAPFVAQISRSSSVASSSAAEAHATSSWHTGGTLELGDSTAACFTLPLTPTVDVPPDFIESLSSKSSLRLMPLSDVDATLTFAFRFDTPTAFREWIAQMRELRAWLSGDDSGRAASPLTTEAAGRGDALPPLASGSSAGGSISSTTSSDAFIACDAVARDQAWAMLRKLRACPAHASGKTLPAGITVVETRGLHNLDVDAAMRTDSVMDFDGFDEEAAGEAMAAAAATPDDANGDADADAVGADLDDFTLPRGAVPRRIQARDAVESDRHHRDTRPSEVYVTLADVSDMLEEVDGRAPMANPSPLPSPRAGNAKVDSEPLSPTELDVLSTANPTPRPGSCLAGARVADAAPCAHSCPPGGAGAPAARWQTLAPAPLASVLATVATLSPSKPQGSARGGTAAGSGLTNLASTRVSRAGGGGNLSSSASPPRHAHRSGGSGCTGGTHFPPPPPTGVATPGRPWKSEARAPSSINDARAASASASAAERAPLAAATAAAGTASASTGVGASYWSRHSLMDRVVSMFGVNRAAVTSDAATAVPTAAPEPCASRVQPRAQFEGLHVSGGSSSSSSGVEGARGLHHVHAAALQPSNVLDAPLDVPRLAASTIGSPWVVDQDRHARGSTESHASATRGASHSFVEVEAADVDGSSNSSGGGGGVGGSPKFKCYDVLLPSSASDLASPLHAAGGGAASHCGGSGARAACPVPGGAVVASGSHSMTAGLARGGSPRLVAMSSALGVGSQLMHASLQPLPANASDAELARWHAAAAAAAASAAADSGVAFPAPATDSPASADRASTQAAESTGSELGSAGAHSALLPPRAPPRVPNALQRPKLLPPQVSTTTPPVRTPSAGSLSGASSAAQLSRGSSAQSSVPPPILSVSLSSMVVVSPLESQRTCMSAYDMCGLPSVSEANTYAQLPAGTGHRAPNMSPVDEEISSEPSAASMQHHVHRASVPAAANT